VVRYQLRHSPFTRAILVNPPGARITPNRGLTLHSASA
jgi:hypothetical protein